MISPVRFQWRYFFAKKNKPEQTIVDTLRKNMLFAKLQKAELQYLSKVVHVRNYELGEPVFLQFEKGLGMYIIVKGAVDIKVRSPDGGDIVVTKLETGSFFGEMALIDDQNQRSASAVAAEPLVLIGFFKPDLMEITERKPEMGVKILLELSKVLGWRLNETTDALSSLQRGEPPAARRVS